MTSLQRAAATAASTANLIEDTMEMAEDIVEGAHNLARAVRNRGNFNIGQTIGMKRAPRQRKVRSYKRQMTEKRALANKFGNHAQHASVFGIGSHAKRTQVILTSPPVAVTTRRMYVTSLTEIARVNNLASGLDTDKRLTDVIHLSGCKVNMWLTSDQLQERMVNMAVIIPRNNQSITTPDTLTVTNFFQGNAGRAEDFGATKTGIESCTLPISTDNFEILWRKKKILNVFNGATVGAGATARFNLTDTYIRINKEVRFQGAGASSAVNNVYFVMWIDNPLAPASDPAAALGTRALHITSFWRESQ